MNEKEIENKLDKWLSQTEENECLEFKGKRNGFSTKEFGKYFSALSNEAKLSSYPYSFLIFGVENKINPKIGKRNIIGTDYKKGTLEKFKKEISDKTNPKLTFDYVELFKENTNGIKKRIIIFIIPAGDRNIITEYDEHAYHRIGESAEKITLAKRKEIMNYYYDWSAEIIKDATINDLDKEAIKIARKQYKEKKGNKISENFDTWTNKDFLYHANITNSSKITKTALLLLGKPESLHYLGMREITWSLFNDKNEKISFEVFKPPFILTINNVLKKIRNYKIQIFKQNELMPVNVDIYDNKSLRELVCNCIAHQDYTYNERINIEEYPNKLKLINRGSFIPKNIKTVLEQKCPEKYRNEFLVSAMRNLNMVETGHFGIPRIFNERRKRMLPMPDYNFLENNTRIEVVLDSAILDKNYVRILAENTELPLYEIFLLDKFQKKQKLTKEERKILRQKNLIDGKRNNLYISKEIAKKTGKQADYTTNKGLQIRQCKDYIMQHINDYKSINRREAFDILNGVLSKNLTINQKNNKIRRILYKLKKEGKIINTGGNSPTKARWILLKSTGTNL